MIDIGIKEDKRALKNESDINKRRVVTRQIRSRGRGQRTVTKIILNNIQRPFKFWYALFAYYGPQVFENSIFPQLKNLMKDNFEEREHANAWKIIMFDILAAFVRTSKFYQSENMALYHECWESMHQLYDSKAKPEIKTLYSNSLRDCFNKRDPQRIDKIMAQLISSLPLSSPIIIEKNLEILNILVNPFGWRMLPYMAELIDKYLDWDPELIKVPANYSDNIPPSLRLVLCKNWREIYLNFICSIQFVFRVCELERSDSIDKITNFFEKAIQELRDFESESEAAKLIINNSLKNLASFFHALYTIR